jgi:hypothetical protein
MPVSRHRQRYSQNGAIEHFRALFYKQRSAQFIQTINECLFGLVDSMKIVICMALTRQRPSRTPLFATNASTVEVIFTNPRRSGTSNHSCSVSDLIGGVSYRLEPDQGKLSCSVLRGESDSNVTSLPDSSITSRTLIVHFYIVGFFVGCFPNTS